MTMTAAAVAWTSVNTNSLPQDYCNPGDQLQAKRSDTPRFQLFTLYTL